VLCIDEELDGKLRGLLEGVVLGHTVSLAQGERGQTMCVAPLADFAAVGVLHLDQVSQPLSMALAQGAASAPGDLWYSRYRAWEERHGRGGDIVGHGTVIGEFAVELPVARPPAAAAAARRGRRGPLSRNQPCRHGLQRFWPCSRRAIGEHASIRNIGWRGDEARQEQRTDLAKKQHRRTSSASRHGERIGAKSPHIVTNSVARSSPLPENGPRANRYSGAPHVVTPGSTCGAGIIVADHGLHADRRICRRGELVMADNMLLTIGGCAANTAVDLAKMGARVAIVGRVGRDVFGRVVSDIPARLPRSMSRASRRARRLTQPNADCQRAGSGSAFHPYLRRDQEFSAADIPLQLLDQVKVLYLGGYLVMPGVTQES